MQPDANTGEVMRPDASSDAGPSPNADASAPQVQLPPVDAGFDYQLGGAYTPPASVAVVARDRTEPPAAGLYNICYVNGFQAQESDNDFWLSEQPDLVLRDDSGDPVIDRDWDEMLLDVSSADKRTRLAAIVGEWIAGCAADGFDAVEIDNLDSYTRSGGRLEADAAVAYLQLLAKAAHARGLAIAQKNSSELVPRHGELGTDFAVIEECNRYDECDDYRAGYGDHLLIIEYTRSAFEAGCAAYPGVSIVLRDLDLVSPGDSAYVYEGC